MKLVDVYTDVSTALDTLWSLLSERTDTQAISHRHMPTFAEHCAFVLSHPYEAWYFIEVHGRERGACYLSKQREIGVFIFNEFRGEGHGRAAVRMLMAKHPGKFLANVNPHNLQSARMFESLGFKMIQHTYAHE